MSMTMHQWRSCQIRTFVPPGYQLFVEVSFHTPTYESEVRIQDAPHAHGGGVGTFQSGTPGAGTWSSPPNTGTSTRIWYIEPRYRDPNRPAPAWQHFDDERAALLFSDDANAVYGFEEGRDADFNDSLITLHWRRVE